MPITLPSPFLTDLRPGFIADRPLRPGTTGVYEKGRRVWRVKTKHKVGSPALLVYTSFDEMIIWQISRFNYKWIAQCRMRTSKNEFLCLRLIQPLNKGGFPLPPCNPIRLVRTYLLDCCLLYPPYKQSRVMDLSLVCTVFMANAGVKTLDNTTSIYVTCKN